MTCGWFFTNRQSLNVIYAVCSFINVSLTALTLCKTVHQTPDISTSYDSLPFTL